MANAESGSEVTVMVNGMPGPMAIAAAEACLRKGLKLSPVAMTRPEIDPCILTISDAVSGKSSNVQLIPSTETDELEAAIAGAREGAGGEKNLLAIDYTHPSAVNANALFYIGNQTPFVMGTTGGDREKLMADVTAAKHFAVIAPNMGKQIVAMQAALEDLASTYPSAFAGYSLQVTESHQKTKVDTSGTAKAVIDSLKTLSDDGFSYDDINMIRGDQEAVEFGVPEEGLHGHAFHTYTLTSSDGSVQFQLQHNVVGRTSYAEGTADAVKFLSKKLQTEQEGRVYSMINVLEAGALDGFLD
ncbi:tetrahydrodipicolinate reductase 2, chloroplastic [Seminavis robusta]|uniref:4-hydroxy-tetrahydrodipicolinate reductase n=1 Tax=Seminavis robusta TaxID=568900 RepID=A0A9N8E855_9STRA|nr:tetrahydrodipicolinate reductase 2, chloroplastic [Seminavis robusta]|eukprot:Sro774_g200640.1 tetrahydrodipicolinate reductase 2, chloroplastic (301) ;mRNA; f:19993-20895